MSIDVESCTFTYPGTDIGVHDVSVSAGEGELIAVIGASGSGKTTLLKLVAGFEQPRRGRIVISGHDMTGVPARKRDIGVVFQSYALFPLMTCVDNVAYPLKIRGVARGERTRLALEMLERVNLSEQALRYPARLSGGQQQRVALARALVFRPRVLLLDEPLSALDAGLRVELRKLIRELQKEQGITALHVTHDQEEALSMADQVALMDRGRIVQCGSPFEIYDHPVNRKVAAFVGQANLWNGTVEDGGRITLDWGVLSCDTADRAPGERVTVLVRPEGVVVNPGDGAVNRIAGRVVHDTFLGAMRRFEFHPEGAAAGVVVQGETARREAIASIAIPPEHVRLLPPD
ncbi:MAG: ABC transporter ATP-binding protein [Planctomycetes bacterium]|nr:ABC transporter ATP-binding protein [Planctomycetota bacterium]